MDDLEKLFGQVFSAQILVLPKPDYELYDQFECWSNTLAYFALGKKVFWVGDRNNPDVNMQTVEWAACLNSEAVPAELWEQPVHTVLVRADEGDEGFELIEGDRILLYAYNHFYCDGFENSPGFGGELVPYE